MINEGGNGGVEDWLMGQEEVVVLWQQVEEFQELLVQRQQLRVLNGW